VSDRERAKRPPLERSAPIRSWSALLRAPQSEDHAGASEPASERIDDVIVRSVELGYRVIDDYVKRGQVAAQRMQHGAYGPGDMARDAQGVAGQMVRSAADLAGAWVEFFALTTRDGNGAGNGHDAAATAASAAAPAPVADAPPAAAPVASVVEPLRVRLRVSTARAVETALDVRPVPADHRLVVHALRGADGARIDDVRVETGDGTAVIAIRVSSEHPAGPYTGLVVDDTTNVPVGVITLVIAPE
jgi:hypothetical protein